MVFITGVHTWCSLVGGFTILFHPLSPNSDKNEVSLFLLVQMFKSCDENQGSDHQE